MKLLLPLLMILTQCLVTTVDVSQFGYYRRIQITNTETYAIEADHKFEINTFALTWNDKMNQNCSDLVIVNESYEEIDYWFESGCGLPISSIWIHDNFKPGLNVFFMYYGNPDYTTGGIQSDVTFLTMQKYGCDEYYKWENFSSFDGRYLRGMDNATNFPLGGSVNFAHDHHLEMITSGTYSNYPDNYKVNYDDVEYDPNDSSIYELLEFDHYHKLDADLEESTQELPHVKIEFCKSKGNMKVMPIGTLVGIENSSEVVWNNKLQSLDLNGKFLMANEGYWSTDNTYSVHTHKLPRFGSPVNEKYGIEGYWILDGYNIILNKFHEHNFLSSARARSYSSEEISSLIPPYRTMLFAEIIYDTFPVHGMYIFADQVPPMGYSETNLFNGKFIRMGTGNYEIGGYETHSHTVGVNDMFTSNVKNEVVFSYYWDHDGDVVTAYDPANHYHGFVQNSTYAAKNDYPYVGVKVLTVKANKFENVILGAETENI